MAVAAKDLQPGILAGVTHQSQQWLLLLRDASPAGPAAAERLLKSFCYIGGCQELRSLGRLRQEFCQWW